MCLFKGLREGFKISIFPLKGEMGPNLVTVVSALQRVYCQNHNSTTIEPQCMCVSVLSLFKKTPLWVFGCS